MIDWLFLDKGRCYLCKENEISVHKLCNDCLKKLDYVANQFKIDSYDAHAVYFYNEAMKKMVGDYKFNRNTSLSKVFSSILYDYARVHNLFDVDYILPSPSSNKTINRRGFDHIRLITDNFIDDIRPSYLEGFIKSSDTKAQHELSKEERAYNLKGAFSFNKDLTGKSVLIIDDLITTGNTALEIIRTLKLANAKEVTALAITSEHRIN